MKIQASKVFADFINRTAANMGFKARAELVYFTENGYTMNVNIWGPSWSDYDSKTGKYKVIRVEYPAEYYAAPVYLTTGELCAEFRRRNVRDFDGLAEMIRDLLYI